MLSLAFYKYDIISLGESDGEGTMTKVGQHKIKHMYGKSV